MHTEWNERTGSGLDRLEAFLSALTDDEVRAYLDTLSADDPNTAIVAGELERRGLD